MYGLFSASEAEEALNFMVGMSARSGLFKAVTGMGSDEVRSMIQSLRTSSQIINDANSMKAQDIIKGEIIPNLVKFLDASGEEGICVIHYSMLDILTGALVDGVANVGAMIMSQDPTDNTMYVYLRVTKIKNPDLYKYLTTIYSEFDPDSSAMFKIYPMDQNSVELSMLRLTNFMSGIFSTI